MKNNTEKYEILVLLRHYWKKGVTATAATQQICEIEGEGVIKVRKAQLWFREFNSGNTSLERKKGSGRPKIVDPTALLTAVETNPRVSTRQLSADFGASHMTISRNLKAINKVYRRCREVPHELTPENTQRRVEICKQLLSNPLDELFLNGLLRVMKSGSIFETKTIETSGLTHLNQRYQL